MRFSKIATIALSAAFALCLASCGSGESQQAESDSTETEASEAESDSPKLPELEEEVTLGSITYRIPSGWVGRTAPAEGVTMIDYNMLDASEEKPALSVCEQSELEFSSIEQEMELKASMTDIMGWKNFNIEACGERLVDGLPCYLMASSSDFEDENGETYRPYTYTAYVVGESGYWQFDSSDWDFLNAVLDTVTIA